MSSEYFKLERIPDLTLAQYSAEESGGVDDVIRQHGIFYRQLNRKGILFRETFHIIYVYNPRKSPGNRLNVYFRADGVDNAPICMNEFMTASSLSSYFKFITHQLNDEESSLTFPYQATLLKRGGFVSSSFPEKNLSFYTVNPWKPNEKGRLLGLFRIMQKLQRPAAYTITLQAADFSESMRTAFRGQIQFIRNSQKLNNNMRDDNAEQCLRLYDKFLESLRNTPHFLCRICAFAEHPALAKMILDAAAAEAVEEGNYNIDIVPEKGCYSPFHASNEIKSVHKDSVPPRGMENWNTIFLLKEVPAFAMFPVLYPGETIEIPKESAPVYENTGLELGTDNNGYKVFMPLNLLSKHALLAGVPGGGKTFSMLHIASHLCAEPNNIPILVLEPAKKEYRALVHNERLPNLLVFSPGAPGSFPLRINPFEFPLGMKLSEHITSLVQVFNGAFDLTPPMPRLVTDGILQVYRDKGWYPFEINDGKHVYPSMQDLYTKMGELLDKSDYAPEIKSNLKSCLQVRIGSLLLMEMGNVFNVPGSTLQPEEWLQTSCVIELESLGPDAANFLTLLLLTIIRELLRQNPHAPKDRPRHVIFLEEAHNLIGPTTVANSENGDAKVASTQYIVDMLAEVRALQEAIIIADQLPTGLAPQVTKNTSLKIAHKITAMDDRQLLASTMSADGVQLEKMAVFEPGQALCIYEKVQKPFELRITKYDDNPESPENGEMFNLLAQRAIYQKAMEQDFQIMHNKFRLKRNQLDILLKKRQKDKSVYQHNVTVLDNDSISGKLPSEKRELLKETDRLQTVRNLTNWAHEWVEYLLEMNDYCNSNRLYSKKNLEIFRSEVKYFNSIVLDAFDIFPDELSAVMKFASDKIKPAVLRG